MKGLTMAAALCAFAALGVSADIAPAAEAPSFTFPSIEGAQIDTADFRGHPVLVVNTASLCGFTPQLEGLQKLHEDYGPKGLIVLAVPSDDFAQELDSAKEVSEFCTLTYGITLPMTDITHVKGASAHPFYQWVKEETGFVPSWNFNKVLIDGAGQVVETWGAMTKPGSAEIRAAFEPLLPGA
ncbi:glutathione peroxidase [Rhodobacter lacus]|uniref:Glutathione peroxidase n=1 Tax=Rhodobacter lacus TaxID=1641972 RepID=A0ABW5A5X5_9RHOB